MSLLRFNFFVSDTPFAASSLPKADCFQVAAEGALGSGFTAKECDTVKKSFKTTCCTRTSAQNGVCPICDANQVLVNP
jgi:hypothetical protein